MLTKENSYDLGRDGAGESQTVRCLWPATDLFQLKIQWAEVHLCLACAD